MNTTIFRQVTAILGCIFILGCQARTPKGIKFVRKDNPLIKHMYTADPSARVFKGRLYVYTSHDRDSAKYYDMLNWHVFSTANMRDWTDHGAVFSLDDISWADKWAWAPDAVERNGKYYLYYPVERTKIGVAVSDKPTGPFKDPIGRPLIDNAGQVEKIGPEPIDPGMFIHKGQAYMYFGCREPRVVKLKENMTALDGEVMKVKIQGIDGDKESQPGGFYGEGPWVFERDGKIYYMYSNGWGKHSTLVYAMGKDPLGPFEFEGEVMAPVTSSTSHGSIVSFKGKWYVFYHDNSLSGNHFRRSVCFDEITFDKDGKINRIKPSHYK